MAKKLSKSAIEAVLKGKNKGDASKLAKEIYDILKSGARVEKDREALTSQQYDKMKASLDALMESESTRTENLKMLAMLGEEKHLMEENAIDLMKDKLELMIREGKATGDQIFSQKMSIEARQADNDELERSNKLKKVAAGASDRVAEGLKKTIGYNEKYAETMAGSTMDMAIMFKTSKGGYAELVKSLKKTVTAEGLVFNAMEKVGESMVMLAKESMKQMTALDEQQVGFRKATGLGKEYDQMMKDTYEANKLNGVSVEENAKAMGDLVGTMTDFTMLGNDQKKMLTETAGILQEVGVSTESFAASTQIMNKGLGMGAEDAAQFSTTMVAMAEDIGMAPQQMFDAFEGAAGTMSALSGGAEAAQTAMRGLSATSKVTGIAIDRIIDITSQFDTFEGASESVGALNAMLGGDFINAMDVMAAEDPAERFGMMQQALDDAGKSFDDMTYYEKKAIAESMGLKDTNELAMLMSGNMDDLAGDFGKTSDEIVEMKKQAKANQSVSESFQQLLAQMAPTFQLLIDAARGFVEMLQKLGPLLPYVGAGLTVLGVGLFGAYMQMRMMAITGVATGKSFAFMGKAGMMAGLKIMLGFAAFVLLAALIYGVYKWLGPLGGGFALLGIAAVLAGIAIATGLTTATGGLYLIIPAVILAVAGLAGVIYALYTRFKEAMTNMMPFIGLLLLFMGPVAAIIGGIMILVYVVKLMKKRWEDIKAAMQPVADIFIQLWDSVKQLWVSLKPLVDMLAELGGAFFSMFGGEGDGDWLVTTFKVLAFVIEAMLVPLKILAKFLSFVAEIITVLTNLGDMSWGMAIDKVMAAGFKLLGFEDGGTAPGGPIVVGESGPEIVAPPAGYGILPSPISGMLSSLGGMFGGGGGAAAGGQEVNLNVTLELEGRELATYIKKVALPVMNPAGGTG